MQNLHCNFVLCSNGEIYGGDFAKFCGLLRIYELYKERQYCEAISSGKGHCIDRLSDFFSTLLLSLNDKSLLKYLVHLLKKMSPENVLWPIKKSVPRKSSLKNWQHKKILMEDSQTFLLLLEPVCCKKQEKKFLTSYWFAE